MPGKRLKSAVARLLCSALLLVSSIVCVRFASGNPETIESWYTGFSRAVSSFLGRIFSVFPFSLSEALICLTILLLISYIIFGIAKSILKRDAYPILSAAINTVLLFTCVYALFLTLWGLNYSSMGISVRVGLSAPPATVSELYGTTRELSSLACEYAEKVPRNGQDVADFGGFDALKDKTASGFESLSRRYPFFGAYSAPPKRLLLWPVFSYAGLSGVYIPFTGEANVNPDEVDSLLPFVMLHEMSHRLGAAQEDEANFAAFLACRESDSPEFRYSGYLSAFRYCLFALAGEDQELAGEVISGLSEPVLNDMRAINEHYSRYEGALQEASSSINDTYLKAMSDPSGVKSYGKVVDLLIAERLSREGAGIT